MSEIKVKCINACQSKVRFPFTDCVLDFRFFFEKEKGGQTILPLIQNLWKELLFFDVGKRYEILIHNDLFCNCMLTIKCLPIKKNMFKPLMCN